MWPAGRRRGQAHRRPTSHRTRPTATATATTEPDPGGRLSISSVQPGTLVNDVEVELIVTGTGFVDGSVVVINRISAVWQRPSSARASCGPRCSPGCRRARTACSVVKPDAATAELPDALRISPPPGRRGRRTQQHPRADGLRAAVARRPVLRSQRAADHARPESRFRDDHRQRRAGHGHQCPGDVHQRRFRRRARPAACAPWGRSAPARRARFWQPLFATTDLARPVDGRAQGHGDLHRCKRPELRLGVRIDLPGRAVGRRRRRRRRPPPRRRHPDRRAAPAAAVARHVQFD